MSLTDMASFSAILAKRPLRIATPLTEHHKRAQGYFPAPGLAEAIDVAMLLGQPLLLTGEPGTGKTRAAYWLANEIGAEPLLRFDVKSASSGTDLLYQFDEVARFRDSTRQEKYPLVRYLRFNALGEAILRAAGPKAVLQTIAGEPLEGSALETHQKLLDDAFGNRVPPLANATAALLLPDDAAFSVCEPEHRVVLVDELDKAPRDTPNDLLVEIEDMEFRIPELGIVVKADPNFRPVVIITSNSEKSLPDPFLRRCTYFDITFPRRFDQRVHGSWPGQGTLEQIVDAGIDALSGGGPLVDQALGLFQRLRRPDSGLRKVPGTAELLAWLDVLVSQHQLGAKDDLISKVETVDATLCAVVKTKDDLEAARRIAVDWAGSRRQQLSKP
jgi:MoxR-like ATPase